MNFGPSRFKVGYRPTIMSPYGRVLPVVFAVVVSMAVVACGTDPRAEVTASRVQSVEPGAPQLSRPVAVPLVAGELRTTQPVTVLDDGEGPQLCGFVAESYPPQCSGYPLLGWDWNRVEHETASGTRWTSAVLTGTFDGLRFTVTGVDTAATGEPRPVPGFAPACPEPEGGWQVVDPDATAQVNLSGAAEWARGMEEVGAVWVTEITPGNAADAILTVTTTGDVASLELELRRVWGGKLCVAEAVEGRTDADLQRIVDEVRGLPGLETAQVSSSEQVVEVTVFLDDGSIQRWADAEYGPGVVGVSSRLVPVDET